MKQILGLDTGTVTFTPGGAGAGTVVFAGVTCFSPARVMAVTNITRKSLIYVSEAPGLGGTWSSVTSTGATLTLDFDTTGHNSGDVLRCLYEGDELQEYGEDNRIDKDLDAWTLSANTTRTVDYGDGPLPGTRSVRVTLASPSFETGIQNEIFTRGRTDCARYSFSIYARGSGQVEVGIYARNEGLTQTMAKQVTYTLTSEWKLITAEHINPFYNTTIVRVFVKALNATPVTCELACPGLWEGLPTGKIPRWSKPVPLTDRGFEARTTNTQSVCCWGDSLFLLSASRLDRYLNGGFTYNGGVSGETSTQIATRATAAVNPSYNNLGVVLIWAGRNNRTDPATVLTDIDSMVAVVPHGRFLVLSVTNDTTETLGTFGYNCVAQINTRLAAKYGEKFVDVRSALCAGNANDVPNSAWMADAIHPNAAGFGIVYQCIYAAMLRNGYLPWLNEFGVDYSFRKNSAWWAFTRPSDTTAYASGDLVANSTTAGSVVIPQFPLNKPHSVIRLRLSKTSTNVANASFRIHLFGDLPITSGGDNAALAITGARSYIGQFDITISQAWADGATGYVDVGANGALSGVPYGHSLYAVIEARAAYTPTSAEVFTLTAELEP